MNGGASICSRARAGVATALRWSPPQKHRSNIRKASFGTGSEQSR